MESQPLRTNLLDTTCIAPDAQELKRLKIDAERKQQASKTEEERKKKEAERAQHKKIQTDWMKAGIETKAKLNKSLDINQKELISKAKGTAMSGCFSLWNAGERAGNYDKSGYIQWINQGLVLMTLNMINLFRLTLL